MNRKPGLLQLWLTGIELQFVGFSNALLGLSVVAWQHS